MNWEAINAVAAILGAVAVIATLIYVATQVRHSADQAKSSAQAVRSAAVTDATSGMQSIYQTLGTNADTSRLFFNALVDPDSLSTEDQFQYLMLMHSFFLGFQRNYFLAEEGTLNEELRDSIGKAIVAINNLPGMDFYWRQRKSFFQPEFVKWAEKLMASETRPEMEVYKDGRDAVSG